MDQYTWYSTLIKPSWAPPSYLFGPVWMVLYTLIAISFCYVFFLYFRGKVSFLVVLPFIANLVFNALFTYLQFRLQNNLLASFDIALVVITLVIAMITIYPYARWVTYIQIPYLVWVLFATALQFTITFLNR